jgi:hypothetical protein
MKLFPLIFLLIVLLFISCKKVTDPIMNNDPLIGTWQESFTWLNYEDCVPVDSDFSACEITQQSVLSLNGDKFTARISPCIEYPPVIHDTLFTGKFIIHTDTILFILDRDTIIRKILYQVYDNSLNLQLYDPFFSDSLAIKPNAVFLWGNARNKIFGTFSRVE